MKKQAEHLSKGTRFEESLEGWSGKSHEAAKERRETKMKNSVGRVTEDYENAHDQHLDEIDKATNEARSKTAAENVQQAQADMDSVKNLRDEAAKKTQSEKNTLLKQADSKDEIISTRLENAKQAAKKRAEDGGGELAHTEAAQISAMAAEHAQQRADHARSQVNEVDKQIAKLDNRTIKRPGDADEKEGWKIKKNGLNKMSVITLMLQKGTRKIKSGTTQKSMLQLEQRQATTPQTTKANEQRRVSGRGTMKSLRSCMPTLRIKRATWQISAKNIAKTPGMLQETRPMHLKKQS